jgi:hypothetical protein
MAASFSHPASRSTNTSFSGRFGVHITDDEWEKQRTAGIRALPRLKVQFSKTHGQYVLCADEAGGATSEIGHYCGFLPLDGDPTFFVRPVTEVMPNTIHAEIAAASLISFEMVRVGTSYSLNIFLHWCAFTPRPNIRPSVRKKLLFSSTRGFLSKELWTAGKSTQIGNYMPAFHSRTGDPHPIPPVLHEAVAAITDAVCCIDCRKSHFLALTPVTLPEELSSTKVRKVSAAKTSQVKSPASVPVVPTVSSAELKARIFKARRNKKKNALKKEKRRLAKQQRTGEAAPPLISQPVDLGDGRAASIAAMFTPASLRPTPTSSRAVAANTPSTAKIAAVSPSLTEVTS